MNPPTAAEAGSIFATLRTASKDLKRSKTIVCPSHVHLQHILKLKKHDKISVGAQGGQVVDNGSMTGEVSLSMIAHAGATSVILGHSERRAQRHETSEFVSQQIARALAVGLMPIICVGEKVHDGEGKFLHELSEQIKTTLTTVGPKNIVKCVIAYEPVWAIGTGVPMAAQTIYEMTIFVRKILADIYGPDVSVRVPVVYGGSVTSKNIEEIMTVGQCDGVLVGKESLNARAFSHIIDVVENYDRQS